MHDQAREHDRDTDGIRIPVLREELDVRTQTVETGRLHVRTHVSEREETVELPLSREEFTVERIAVGRTVDVPAEVRQEGDVTIVPVHAEEFVLTRRLVLKEELHIRRHVREAIEHRQVALRTQRVDVVREPAATGGSPSH